MEKIIVGLIAIYIIISGTYLYMKLIEWVIKDDN